MNILKAMDIHAGYGAIKALNGVSLFVDEGEFVVVIGPNGAGKSTIVKVIAGLIRPQSGTIEYREEKINDVPTYKLANLGIMLVPEGRQILSQMTVFENLEMGAYHRSDSAQVRNDLKRITQNFPVLNNRKGQMAGTLSGGEQQILAIARAQMARPKLLMLDEPSLGLSPLMVNVILKTITQVREEGTTILLAEQNARKALQFSDRAYVLDKGSIVLNDDSARLARNEMVKERYLGVTR